MTPDNPRPARGLATHSFLVALAAALVIGALGSFATPGDVAAATTSNIRIAACSAALRTGPHTSSTRKLTVSTGTSVKIASRVSGGYWRSSCAGATLSGRFWYRIALVDGHSVKARYGVSYLYAPASLFNYATAVARFAGCTGVNLRTGTSATTTKKGSLRAGTRVAVVATVGGSSWSGTCAGGTLAGNQWYRIKSINGTSVKRLFGVSYVYAAAGLFTAAAPLSLVTEGIDVSHWQGPIDWTKVWLAGKRFAFIKASQGQTIVDDTYQTNRTGAKGVGMRVGAYHFASPSSAAGCDFKCDAAAEADHFVDTAQVASGELRPVLDLEQAGGLSVANLQTWVKTFLARVYSRTGVRGVIYVSPAFWTKYMGDTSWFATNGYDVLWIAHWTTAPSPTLPATNWGSKGWTFWQYTSSGSVPGIGGRVDLDRYAGTDFSKVSVP